FHWDDAQNRLGLGNNAPTATLDVTGNAAVSGNFAINTDKLTIAGATGNTMIGGSLNVVGDVVVDTSTFFVGVDNNQVGIGTITPHASAVLDIDSSLGGFLPPRLSSTERNAVSGPAAGLIVYNETTNK